MGLVDTYFEEFDQREKSAAIGLDKLVQAYKNYSAGNKVRDSELRSVGKAAEGFNGIRSVRKLRGVVIYCAMTYSLKQGKHESNVAILFRLDRPVIEVYSANKPALKDLQTLVGTLAAEFNWRANVT